MKAFFAQIPLLLKVISDFRVIATLIGFFLVIMIAGGIANYSKKAHVPKAKKGKSAPPPVQEPEESKAEAETDEDTTE
ncbi:MAG: hypothetical protein MJ182_01390 [Treponema sp.]|nr:hypothetical protein [Treponema sp.]